MGEQGRLRQPVLPFAGSATATHPPAQNVFLRSFFCCCFGNLVMFINKSCLLLCMKLDREGLSVIPCQAADVGLRSEPSSDCPLTSGFVKGEGP